MSCKNFIFKSICLLAVLTACSCNSEKFYVQKAVLIMDKLALYAEGPEWEAAKSEALAASPADRAESNAVIRKALKVAGGKHSFLMDTGMVADNDTTIWTMPTVSVEPDGIAVITLPEFLGGEADAKQYMSSVLDALPENPSGAVVDLRGNTGGNMYPMIASVHQFLPDDDVIVFRSRKRRSPITSSYILLSMGLEARTRFDCPVAILTDSLTASSGEATLLCFRGLENARSFGSPTAGYASANRPIKLSDGAMLVVTTSCDVTRTNEEFCDDPIVPDVPTETPLEDALAWIRSK